MHFDPIIIAGQTNSPINFLARADIFKNKLADITVVTCFQYSDKEMV